MFGRSFDRRLHRFETHLARLLPSQDRNLHMASLRNKILITALLAKQVTTLECPICKSDTETADHLFVHCPWSSKLWGSCMSWWDILWCPNPSLKEWAEGWPGLCSKASSKRVWSTLFYAVIWTIWKERNHLIFKGKHTNNPTLNENNPSSSTH
ncbi:hypothetical protein LWI29_020104 [Acer saccharum]|uniref:Reverse transcriptase zinc-binding domain-containing protein n=1 Tax=Acer saccharum TaxID=4024 RepID=A0AA39SM86_ACESA|nr:hypothetical protein LWI29_020104 [Acer saccharum]